MNSLIISPSRLGLATFAGIIGGIGIGSVGFISLSIVFAAFVLSAFLLIDGFLRRRRLILLGFFLLALSLGALRADFAFLPAARIEAKSVHVFATVQDTLSKTATAQRTLISVRDESLPAQILLVSSPAPELQRGDEILVSGTLKDIPAKYTSPGGPQAEIYFPKTIEVKSVGWSFVRLADLIRQRFTRSLHAIFAEPAAAYMAGLLLGEKTSLPTSLKGALSKTGTAHIVALSGYNITIVAISISWLLLWFHASPRVRFLGGVLGILIFIFIASGGASGVRAAIMGFLGLLAKSRGRIFEMTNALLFAAVCMLALDPSLLIFNLSFQLSFLATLGLVIMTPILQPYLAWIPAGFDLRGTVAATLSAEIFVLPLISWHFGVVSLISPITNLLVLPLIPLTMLFGFIAAAVGILIPWLGFLVGLAARVLISYELGVITLTAKIPFASLNLSGPYALAFGLVPFLFASVYFYQRLVSRHWPK